MREALRLRTITDGPESAAVGRILNDLGLVRKHQNHLDDAERMLRESLVIREKVYGHRHGPVARGLFDLATILAMRGKNAEAEAAYRESLALRQALFAAGKDDVPASTVALTMNGLGQHLMNMGKLSEAEAQIRASLDLNRRTGNLGYAYAMSLLDLGRVVAREHRLAEAEALDRQGLEALTHYVDRGDQRLTDAAAQLNEVLRAEGKRE